MKYYTLIVLLLCLAVERRCFTAKSRCNNCQNVDDLSNLYFFREGEDTLAEVNRKNSIISTNWILNVDKRLRCDLLFQKL
jgi:hypothetical protein